MADEHTPDDVDGDFDDLQLLSRRELEAQIQRRTNELENLMEAMADILIKLDERGEISMVNSAVETVLGYETEVVEGKPFDFLVTDPPEDHQSLVRSGDDLVDRLIHDGQVTDTEVYFSTRDGDSVPMSLSASTLKDEDRIATGIVCVAKDITDRKEADRRAEFLHSLLRHDLGNSMQVSQGFLEVLTETDLTETQQQHVERALNGVEDAIALIEDIKTLNDIGRSDSLQPTNLEPAVAEALERHEGLQEKQGFDVTTELERVMVVGGPLLTEVFANLVENAFLHSNGSELRLETTVTDEQVTVVVDDDGEGIPPENRTDIFEQGVSHGDSSGTGLGMYLVKQLVSLYGGDVTVSESPLGGARFSVTLQPASADSSTA